METLGSSSNGRTPDLHSENEGSTPSESTKDLRHLMKVFEKLDNGKFGASQTCGKSGVPRPSIGVV